MKLATLLKTTAFALFLSLGLSVTGVRADDFVDSDEETSDVNDAEDSCNE